MLSFEERNISKTQAPARHAARLRPLTCGPSCCPARRAGLGGPPDRRNGSRRAAGLCLHGRAVRLHAAWRHGGSVVSPASVRGLTRALAADFFCGADQPAFGVTLVAVLSQGAAVGFWWQIGARRPAASWLNWALPGFAIRRLHSSGLEGCVRLGRQSLR